MDRKKTIICPSETGKCPLKEDNKAVEFIRNASKFNKGLDDKKSNRNVMLLCRHLLCIRGEMKTCAECRAGAFLRKKFLLFDILHYRGIRVSTCATNIALF